VIIEVETSAEAETTTEAEAAASNVNTPAQTVVADGVQLDIIVTENGVVLPDAELEIRDVNNVVVADIVTDSNGKATLPELSVGDYTMTLIKKNGVVLGDAVTPLTFHVEGAGAAQASLKITTDVSGAMTMVLGDLVVKGDSNMVVILGISDNAKNVGRILVVLGIAMMLAGCGVIIRRKKKA
jgi:uncharacterized surface anchored protein